MKNYFQVLGLDVGASDADIKAAYRRLARTCHPDLCGPASANRFAELGEAYRFLSDRLKRAALEHDLLASAKTAEPAARPGNRPEPAGAPRAPRSNALGVGRPHGYAGSPAGRLRTPAHRARALSARRPAAPALPHGHIRAHPPQPRRPRPLTAFGAGKGFYFIRALAFARRLAVGPAPARSDANVFAPAARINCPKKIF